MNILVTGANGQLGNEVRTLSVGTPHSFAFTDVAELDITNRESVITTVKSFAADVIINCAAYTNVDKAESDEAIADIINNKAVENLAIAAKEVGATLIHISTDYVFGAKANVPLNPDAPKDPLGAYGRTKLRGEESIIAVGCKYIIIRTAWLYSPYGKNFVKTMLNLTSSKPELKVVFDQVGSPTYAADLAAFIMHIVNNNMLDKTGVYHYTNEGVATWYDFTMAIRDIAGNTSICDVQPCHSDEFPSPVKRPSFSVLDKTLTKTTFGINIPHWYDALKRCITTINNQQK
ncbi:MAG: dTDP-4-dehydrorhamnose reductase [Marinilabiliaceae bacterium]|nr:dTDP-4-dehydrorhamnose reductase [Marinilabiliaceae bacterium]